MSVAAVLERQPNVRDISIAADGPLRIDPRRYATPELKRVVDGEKIDFVKHSAEMILAYPVLFGEPYGGTYSTEDMRLEEHVKLLASMTLSSCPATFGDPSVLKEYYKSSYTVDDVRQAISNKFFYEVLFVSVDEPAYMSINFDDVKNELFERVDLIKDEMLRSSIKDDLFASFTSRTFEALALSRILFGEEFERSNIWGYAREDFLGGLGQAAGHRNHYLVSAIFFATILESDRVLIDEDKRLGIEFSDYVPVHEVSLPDVRRFD